MKLFLALLAAFAVCINAAHVHEFEMKEIRAANVVPPKQKKFYGFIPMIKDEDFGVK